MCAAQGAPLLAVNLSQIAGILSTPSADPTPFGTTCQQVIHNTKPCCPRAIVARKAGSETNDSQRKKKRKNDVHAVFGRTLSPNQGGT